MESVFLTLDDLVTRLTTYRATTVARTFSDRVPPLSGTCRVEVQFDNGTVVGCHIENEHSSFSGRDAFLFLGSDKKRTFQWHLSTPQPVALPVTKKAMQPTITSIPALVSVSVDRTVWSREQRGVHNLVNGIKTVEQIADLLSKESNAVLRILMSLQALGVITFIDTPQHTDEIKEYMRNLFRSA